MNLPPVASTAVTNIQLPAAKAAPAPAAPPAPASLPKDTVSISPAAQKVSSGDVDHDGDSQ